MKPHELITLKLRSGNYGKLKQELHLDAAEEIDRQAAQLAGALHDAAAALALVADVRLAIGDDGKRMQPELIEHLRQLREAAELACGLLWMIDDRSDKVREAYRALVAALGGPGSPGLKRSIQRAIDAGFEADHPEGATWWAGKKS